MPDSRPTFYGTFRESNAKFLTLIEPVLGYGGLEVDIYDGASPTTMLATLENAFDIAFNEVMGDTGSGGFKISVSDPKATETILRPGNIARFKLHGRYVFAIEIKPYRVTELSSQPQDEVVEISGSGLLQQLDYAQWWPTQATAGTPVISDDGLYWEWVSQPPAAIYVRFLEEAHARGVLPHITYDFTRSVDSRGESWDNPIALRQPVGLKGLAIWKQFAALGLEGRMRYDLRLRAFKTMGVHRDGSATSGLDPVVFEPGTHLLSKEKPERPNTLLTHVVVQGSGESQFFIVSNPALAADPYVGRREEHISVNSDDPTTLQRSGEAYLAMRNAESEPVELPVLHGERADNHYEPYRDYDLGDWIAVRDDTNAAPVSYRIRGLFVGQVGDTQRYGVVLQLNSISEEWEIRLQRKLDALEGTGSTGSGGGSSSVTLGSSNVGPPTSYAKRHDQLSELADDDHPQYQLRSEKGAANGYAPLSSGILVPVGYLGTGIPDATVFLRGDGAWAAPPGAAHPDLATHDTLGLATQAELDAHAATAHGSAHPDLAAHDTLGLATQAELDGHAAAADPHGGYLLETAHTEAAHTAMAGLATQAELDTHAADTALHGGGGGGGGGGSSTPHYSAGSSASAAVTDAAAPYDLPDLAIADVPAGTYDFDIGFLISNKGGQIRITITDAAGTVLWPTSGSPTTYGPNTDGYKEFDFSGRITVATAGTIKVRAAASAQISNYTIYQRRFTLVNAGGAGGGYAEGAAFPASPAVGAKFYRTDLNLLCVFDGTRWLTTSEYSIAWTRRGPDMPFSATMTFGHAPVQERMWVERMILSTFGPAASGSAYWDIVLAKNTPANAQTIVGTLNTQAGLGSGWQRQVLELDHEADPAVHAAWYAMANKIGSPTGVYIGFEVVYRKIVS